jgi:plastocyanin
MRRLLVVSAAAAVLVAPAVPSHAATARQYIGAVAFKFAPGDIVTLAGEPVTLVNLDAAAHDITSDAPGTVNGHLFNSVVLDQRGQKADVVGVAALEPGMYEFYCSVHPEMRGSITVN